jgi:hypothetical protein
LAIAANMGDAMTRGYIRYRSEYKHQLASAYQVAIPIEADIDTEYIQLDEAGELTVKNGYAWDGPSGPVVDTSENMRASLIHDALYQLMRVGKLSSRSHRKTADELFRDMCKEDGVSSFTANIYYEALRKFGKPSASPENKRKIHRAPEDKDKKKKRKRIRAGLKVTQRNR